LQTQLLLDVFTNGQQQLWCNSEHWLLCCYRTKRQITTSMYLWNAGV